MKSGDLAKIITSERIQYMNDGFKTFITSNADKIFRVERVVGKSVKLYKVGFWVSNDFIISYKVL